jgi:prepilin-type N-terminal cleavage/methylation domain-containing protein
MERKKMSQKRLGFTLVEMLMVIIVVAVISAIAIPKVSQ